MRLIEITDQVLFMARDQVGVDVKPTGTISNSFVTVILSKHKP